MFIGISIRLFPQGIVISAPPAPGIQAWDAAQPWDAGQLWS